MKEKILIFQHVEHEHAKRFIDLAEDQDIDYDVIDFWKKWKKPDLSKYSRLIVMGGPQSVYDNKSSFPSKEFEIEAIKNFTKNKKPVLGFCLGSQLIAKAFGAKVYPNIVQGKKFKEVGFYKIIQTEKGIKDKLFSKFQKEFDVFQWHGDIFRLPKNAELIATGDFVKNQVFKIKNSKTYAMLFHFDFLPKMIENLIKIDNRWLHTDNKADEKEIIRKAYELEPQIKEQSNILFKNWMEL